MSNHKKLISRIPITEFLVVGSGVGFISYEVEVRESYCSIIRRDDYSKRSQAENKRKKNIKSFWK